MVADPVGGGLIDSLSRPGGNATGFATADYVSAGKWLEIFKEIAPNVKRALLLRDSGTFSGIGQWGAAEAFARSFELELRPVNVTIAAEIERAVGALARDADGGIIVTNSGPAIVHRDLIIALAARYRMPVVYPQRIFVAAGAAGIGFSHPPWAPGFYLTRPALIPNKTAHRHRPSHGAWGEPKTLTSQWSAQSAQ
jgi:putative ABC transport system substrate-binding protein